MESKQSRFHSDTLLKSRLQNVGHFVQASVCQADVQDVPRNKHSCFSVLIFDLIWDSGSLHSQIANATRSTSIRYQSDAKVSTECPIYVNPRAFGYSGGLHSLSGQTFYGKISWSLEAMGFGIRLFQSLWNLTCTSAAAQPRCLWNLRPIR